MRTEHIAAMINEKRLYVRADGKPSADPALSVRRAFPRTNRPPIPLCPSERAFSGQTVCRSHFVRQNGLSPDKPSADPTLSVRTVFLRTKPESRQRRNFLIQKFLQGYTYLQKCGRRGWRSIKASAKSGEPFLRTSGSGSRACRTSDSASGRRSLSCRHKA